MEIVFLRNDLNYEYEKFILAHELGHVIIHTDIYTAAFNKDLIDISKYEKQAHYFALKVLKVNLSVEDFDGLTYEKNNVLTITNNAKNIYENVLIFYFLHDTMKR